MSDQSTQSNQHRGGWRSLLVWVLLALLLRWQVMEPRWIPSGSMLPTLQLQDRILVEKLRPRLERQRHSHRSPGRCGGVPRPRTAGAGGL